MNFHEVLNSANELTTLFNSSTNYEMVKKVTLGHPKDPLDELYFIKLVTWSYGFFVEAGQSAFRELGNLLKVFDPPAATRNGINNKTVQDLRTVFTHNLTGDERSSGARARRQVDIWLLQNGGSPTDWESCCKALCSLVIETITNLRVCWDNVISGEEDRASSIEKIREAVENKWAPHELDRMIEEAVQVYNISGLDVVAYRKLRWEEWSDLLKCFSNRNDADVGLRRIIHAELKAKFL